MSESNRLKRVLVPGTFDPITYGHLDIIKRATTICDDVCVAVAESLNKRGGTAFTLEERMNLAREVTKDIPGVSVVSFKGLLVDVARDMGAGAVVKGLRAMTDFEYEFQQSALNYKLDPTMETLFIMSNPEHNYLSSSIVREMASLHADVSDFVPQCVNDALLERYKQK